jgi:hypothetical protein
MALTEPGTYSQLAERAAAQFAQTTSFAPPARPREASAPQATEPSRMPLATEASSAQAAALKSAVSESQTPPLVQARGIQAVKAVIGESIGQGNYVVYCYPPNSPKFDIRLPEVVIPSDLRAYGRPVFVAVDVENGNQEASSNASRNYRTAPPASRAGHN